MKSAGEPNNVTGVSNDGKRSTGLVGKAKSTYNSIILDEGSILSREKE